MDIKFLSDAKKNPDANIQKEKKIKEGRKKKGKKQDSCTLTSYFI